MSDEPVEFEDNTIKKNINNIADNETSDINISLDVNDLNELDMLDDYPNDEYSIENNNNNTNSNDYMKKVNSLFSALKPIKSDDDKKFIAIGLHKVNIKPVENVNNENNNIQEKQEIINKINYLYNKYPKVELPEISFNDDLEKLKKYYNNLRFSVIKHLGDEINGENVFDMPIKKQQKRTKLLTMI